MVIASRRFCIRAGHEFYIPANLYIPTAGAPPYPAVLFQMGHSDNGKAYLSTSAAARDWRASDT